MNRMWRSLFGSAKIQVRWTAEKTSNRPYFMFSRLESKLVLAYHVGELNLLTNRPTESMKKLGSLECLTRVCGGLDELSHIQECFGYTARNPWQSTSWSSTRSA